MTDNYTNFKKVGSAQKYIEHYEKTLSHWPVPYDSFYVNTSFGKTHILVSGPEAAPELVLLHGTSFSSTMWFKNIEDLSQSHRVYAVDVLGTASKSIAIKPIKDQAECVNWLNEVFENLRIEKLHLLGHSFGAWVCMNYALSYPNKIKSLVLFSPAATFLSVVKQFYLRLILTMLFPFRSVFISFTKWLGGNGSSTTNSSDLMEQAIFGMQYFKMQMKVIPSVFTYEELQKINFPTLLLLGENEVIYDPKKALLRAKECVNNIHSAIIEDSGHALPMEQSTLVNKHILDFLSLIETH